MAEQNTQITDISGWQRFTDNAKKVIVHAHELAQRYRNPEVQPIHVFMALISWPTDLITRITERLNLDLERTRQKLKQELERRAKVDGVEPKFSDELKQLINNSFLMSEKLAHVYVGSEHLLLAMLDQQDEQFVKELVGLGLNSDNVAKVISSLGTYPPGVLAQAPLDGEAADAASSLPFFCRDMMQQAERGEFMNITGRDKEIDRLIHILSRKTKNNPILVGDAGVGKTAIVQGLVQRILRQEAPGSFLDKQVISLDIAAIIAGAKIRGDVEERILGLINEVIEDGNKIIFIDEIHMIVGAGAYGGRDPMDIGNILKPYLVNPNLRIIGATTVAEYRRYFDDDPALSRRFQPIDIEEIDKQSAIDIIKNLKQEFEHYHRVRIQDEAVTVAVDLSSKFITDRYLPDKAIDVIDEAAASVKIGKEILLEPALSELGEKLLDSQHKKDQALQKQDMEKASKLKQKEEELIGEIADLMEGRHDKSVGRKVVTPELVRQIIVEWTKIPLAAASFDDAKLKHLKDNIRKRIVGQDQVLQSVVDALKRSHLGISNPNLPLASFLFLGPTGVGKTELAKAIAKELFGTPELLVQINMSEYMEMHSVARLIGSPPGYVGYQEGGQLTEQIRRRPYSVVLFDEIEKAHPEVLNILLQILEEGKLTDGKGRTANFHNTVIILTSNIGAEEVSKHNKLGFDVSLAQVAGEELDQAFDEMRDQLMETLKREIRPELLNRLGEITVFRGLNEQDCLEISELMVKELQVRLLESGVVLGVATPVIKLINAQGYSKEYGARNIRRTVQDLLENSLANYIISAKIKKPRKGFIKLNASLKGEQIVFSKEA